MTKNNDNKSWVLTDMNGKRTYCDGNNFKFLSGTKEWLVNDKHHREDGPAIEWSNSNKSWFLDGIEYDKQDYYRELVKRGLISENDAFIEVL